MQCCRAIKGCSITVKQKTALCQGKGRGLSFNLRVYIQLQFLDNFGVADNMYQRSELDYLIYNDPIGYADLILNGNPETYLKTVTEYKPLDS